ncbi:MAG: hypothetical protein ACREQP_10825, partial [Candidatus Binatia bacterium]
MNFFGHAAYLAVWENRFKYEAAFFLDIVDAHRIPSHLRRDSPAGDSSGAPGLQPAVIQGNSFYVDAVVALVVTGT